MDSKELGSMKYFFVKTNRVKVKSLLKDFDRSESHEWIVAPRPLQGTQFSCKYYTAFGCVSESSENHRKIAKLKNHEFITHDEVREYLISTENYWCAGDK
jgi:hypothetical protein